ncbi:glycosyltransferase family 2 protein [Halopseudomonas pelagia]|uniref:glycosyltransferase family 2 protein n=1 Tax=Halopseudomonas pelagia TaxID=553151 RepID=UPI0003A533DB|nr:glycosyltransferase family 2 protein [Halopseudomonas pelagia]|tara:strand:+ start:48424 stop:49488 length:1065 start_codon:yes stop_codon:yes gene_type:complete
MKKVFAVVLTYNRKDLLERSLDAIYAQTRRCDGVIVIDNASSDGTESMLLEAGYPGLQLYVLSHNLGASGGFNVGFRMAFQEGADLVWMMDDDVIAAPDALQRLLEADALLESRTEERAFLLSTAFTENGLVTNSPSIDNRRNKIDYENWPLTLELGILPVRRATFVSILVPRATLEEYGLPIASMFIWGEDTEFTLRVTSKVPGYIVGNSKVQHLRQENGAISIMAENSPSRLQYHRHYFRNEIFVARKYYRTRRLIMSVFNQLVLIFRLLRMRKTTKARIVFQGLLESWRFFPTAESAAAPVEDLGVTVRSPTSYLKPKEVEQRDFALDSLQLTSEELVDSLTDQGPGRILV